MARVRSEFPRTAEVLDEWIELSDGCPVHGPTADAFERSHAMPVVESSPVNIKCHVVPRRNTCGDSILELSGGVYVSHIAPTSLQGPSGDVAWATPTT